MKTKTKGYSTCQKIYRCCGCDKKVNKIIDKNHIAVHVKRLPMKTIDVI